MLGLGPLAFAQPWILAALLALPALWLLLRVTPPAPKSVRFPAIRILSGLTPPEETPARTPIWLLILRLLAMSLLILGLAGPVMHPAASLSGSGPLVMVVDNGWAAAKHWSERQQAMHTLLDRAERDGRRVLLLKTAQDRSNAPLEGSPLMQPAEARERAMAIRPRPWRGDLAMAREAVRDLELNGSAHVVWLSDGLDAPGARELAVDLQRLGRLDITAPEAGDTAMVVLPPESSGTATEVPLRRADPRGTLEVTVVASDEDGGLVGSSTAVYEDGDSGAMARFDLPLELRNRIARITVEGEAHAGATAILDERWQRRPVGLVSEGPLEGAQPLLSEMYYLDRALEPHAEVGRGPLDELLQQELAVLMIADRAALPSFEREAVVEWIEAGGVLLRFAGPRMAQDLTGPEVLADGAEPLLPVRLRRGGRALGGALSWDEPASLAPFAENSPFAGLAIPDEVRIERQVLAEPSVELGEKTWAQLADGTPLVTAEQRGDGWLVLVHTTANTDWSNLPLSGLFVEMLRRIVAMGAGIAAGASDEALPAQQVLDGFGQLRAPDAGVRTISADTLNENAVTPTHPPGLYGRDGFRRAHNLGPAVANDLALWTDLPPGVVTSGFATQPETRIGPWLLTAALVLLLIDLMIALALRGLMPAPSGLSRRTSTAAAVLLTTAVLSLPGGVAAQDDEFALMATLDTRLAYVQTGVSSVDEVTHDGLTGISRILTRRTTVEPDEPLPVDLERDELAFFPFLYWSITPEQPDLSSEAARNVTEFLRGGGTILIDLREARSGSSLFGGSTPGQQALRRLTRGIDMPPLEPVDPEHVLTKAFYLLQEFPGRHSGGTLWVEDTTDASGDGVASVIIGSNDWVGAWAIDERGRPRFATSPGGERQRELAYRTGVNMVMYALTGNYKADQVHVPAILERLGQ